MDDSVSIPGIAKFYKGKTEIEAPDNGRITLASDDKGGQPSISISGHKHSVRIWLSPTRMSHLLFWTPLGQPENKILSTAQGTTVVAALRFYQSHGGPLDEDVQTFLTREMAQSLSADQIDDLARTIYTSRRVVVYPWDTPHDSNILPPMPAMLSVAPAMYVQVIVGGTDPLLIGPFDTDDARDEAAEIAYAKYGPEATILWLNDDNGALTTGAYATDDFEGDPADD